MYSIVNIKERGVLWYLADDHNEAKRKYKNLKYKNLSPSVPLNCILELQPLIDLVTEN